MYERFTDRARKVMQLAQQEAQRFNQDAVRTEHVLIGLLKEGNGLAANALKNLGVDLVRLRSAAEELMYDAKGDVHSLTVDKLPLAPRTPHTITLAHSEADLLSHNYVGTEHLLLGLLRLAPGDAAHVALAQCGVKLQDVRDEVMDLLGHNIGDPGPSAVAMGLGNMGMHEPPATASNHGGAPVDPTWTASRSDRTCPPKELGESSLMMRGGKAWHLPTMRATIEAAVYCADCQTEPLGTAARDFLTRLFNGDLFSALQLNGDVLSDVQRAKDELSKGADG